MAIPKGQFLCLKRNCTNSEDFLREALVLKSRFLTSESAMDSLIVEINNKDCQELLGDRVASRDQYRLLWSGLPDNLFQSTLGD